MHISDKRLRSIAKSISYRVLSVCIDMTVAYFFTRSISMSLGIVLIVNTYSTFLYYCHERIWSHIAWGKRKTLVCPPCNHVPSCNVENENGDKYVIPQITTS